MCAHKKKKKKKKRKEKKKEILECVKKSITVRDKEAFMQLNKALVRLPLEYCIHCSDSLYLRKIN